MKIRISIIINMNTQNRIKAFMVIFLMVIMLSFVSSQGLVVPFGTSGANYSINVNYSESSGNATLLQGYTPTTLRNWFQITYDTIYCKLTGCTINGNITANYFIGDGSELTGISSVSFGTDNQIPFINSAGDDFEYSSGLTYENGKLKVETTGEVGLDVQGGLDFDTVVEAGAAIATPTTGGSVDAGRHYYFITYYTAVGETAKGTNFYGDTDVTNNAIQLSDIPVSTDLRVTGRKIYRTKVGGTSDTQVYLATINNNVDTTYLDTASDSSLGALAYAAYKLDTTNNVMTIDGFPATKLGSTATYYGISSGTSTGAPFNTGFGANTLKYATGFANTAVGQNSGDAITTGKDNALFGYPAGGKITVGSYNTAMGTYALENVVDKYHNTAIGHSALQNNIGSYNTGVGRAAGRAITSGQYNTFLGYFSGYDYSASQLATASYSTGIGYTSYTDADYQMDLGGTNIQEILMGRSDNVKTYWGAAKDGSIEYDGNSMDFDSNAYEFSGWSKFLRNEIAFTLGSTTYTHYGGMGTRADDGTRIYTGTLDNYGNNNIIIAGIDSYWDDFNHNTLSPNPTLFIQSATLPYLDDTQWLSLSHDKTNAIFNLGKGIFKFLGSMFIDGDLTVDGDLNITGIVYETPTAKASAQTAYHNGTDPLVLDLVDEDVYVNVTGLHLDYNNSIYMNGQATINKTAMYHLTGSISFSGGNSGRYRYNLFVNNEEEHACGAMRTTTSNSLGSMSLNCLVYLEQDDQVNMRVKDTSSPVQDVEIYTLTLNMVEI